MRKIAAGIILAAALTIMATGCAGGAQSGTNEGTEKAQAEATQTETSQTEEAWYNEILEDADTRAEYPYYAVQDIDLDGEDELFLSTTENHFIGAEDKAKILTNYEGEVKTLQEIGGAGGEYWICNKIDASLSYYSRLSGEEHIVLYQISKGELKELGTADIYQPHHSPEVDNAETVYLIDGKEVGADEAESFWEQYGNADGAVTFTK